MFQENENKNENNKLDIKAGHGGIKIEVLNNTKTIRKETNAIEALAYLELSILDSKNQSNNIMPKLHRLIIQNKNSDPVLIVEDIQKIKQLNTELKNAIKQLKENNTQYDNSLQCLNSIKVNLDIEYTKAKDKIEKSKLAKEAVSIQNNIKQLEDATNQQNQQLKNNITNIKNQINNLIDSSQSDGIYFILEKVRDASKDPNLKVILNLELLSHSSQNNLQTKSLDVKIGEHTYSDEEAQYNHITDKKGEIKTKHFPNKVQMKTNEFTSRIGGAKNYQIADSKNLLSRQVKYFNSNDNLKNYFNQFNKDDLTKLKEQLNNIHTFIKEKEVAAVGASLFYFGSEVRLIDPAHYMPLVGLSTMPKTTANRQEYHNDLLKAVDEQIGVIVSVMANKIEHTTTTTPFYQQSIHCTESNPERTPSQN